MRIAKGTLCFDKLQMAFPPLWSRYPYGKFFEECWKLRIRSVWHLIIAAHVGHVMHGILWQLKQSLRDFVAAQSTQQGGKVDRVG